MLLFRRKHVYADGAIVEMKAWAVPRSPRTPEGFKYSLVYIDADGRRIVGYDNAHGSGHHRHERAAAAPVDFVSIEDLTERFGKDVAAIRRTRP